MANNSSYGTNRIKRPNRKPSCKPFQAVRNRCWTLKFIYRGVQYSQSFGKCQQGRINSEYISRAIVLDLKHDRFLGSIDPYLRLIPAELVTWRRSPVRCRPFQTGTHDHWVIRFIYKGVRYTHGFGRGNQAGLNAHRVSEAIVSDIENGCFENDITPYLCLIPRHLVTWKKHPKKIKLSDVKKRDDDF